MGNSGKADYRVERFGPFEVHQRLGIGGMATVHLAMERGVEGFERWVALKRLLPHLSDDDEFVRSFVREAQLASRLSHASIVQINQLGKVGEDYFISMEYIEGRDVRALLRQARKVAGPPPLTVIASLLSELLDALDYAHRKTDENDRPLGLVHRDISPSNLLVNTNGHLKIIDFGIAKATTQQSRTQTGKIKGKLAYISPEVLRGKAPDARSDLFSVGIIAHELLTARPLFASKNDYKTIQRIQNAEVLPPSALNINCPTELDDLVIKALAKRRDERWSSAREMLAALHDVTQSFHLHATARDVAGWVDWAFSLPVPRRGDPTEDTHRFRGKAPRAPTLGEGEEELLDIIWGTHGSPRAPLKLDEVAARAAESRDDSIDDTNPGSAAPTALLFAVGPNLGHSDMSIDEGWNSAVTIADADRIGAVIESEFESTEPAGLVGIGDAQPFGTIDLSQQDWSEDVPLPGRGVESAMFSERELTALSEPLGGGVTVPLAPAPDPRPKVRSTGVKTRPSPPVAPTPIDPVAPPSDDGEPRAPFTSPPRGMKALADLSPPPGNFDDTEPTGARITALPEPVLGPVRGPKPGAKPLPSLFDAPKPLPKAKPTTLPPPVMRPPTEAAGAETAVAPNALLEAETAVAPNALLEAETAVAPNALLEAETAVAPNALLEETDEGADSILPPDIDPPDEPPVDPLDVVLLTANVKKVRPPAKKRVTAITTVPPLPLPEEPSVTVTGPPKPPPEPPVSAAPPEPEPGPEAGESVTVVSDRGRDEPQKPTLLVTPVRVAASSSSPPSSRRTTPSSAPPPGAASSPALRIEGSSPTMPIEESSPALSTGQGSSPFIGAPAVVDDEASGPFLVPLRNLDPASIIGEPPPLKNSLVVPILLALAVLSVVGSLAAYFLTRPSQSSGEPSTTPVVVADAGAVTPPAPDAATPVTASIDAGPTRDRPRRKSGEPAVITAAAGVAVPTQVRARVCINRRGRVQSTRVLDSVSDDLRSEVIEAVSAWRYHPYRRDDKPVKACFVESVPVDVR